MPGIADLYDKAASVGEEYVLNPVRRFLGMKRYEYVPPEFDRALAPTGGYPSHLSDYQDAVPLVGVPYSQRPVDLPTSISAYRADPANKYGGGKGLETLPISRLKLGGDWFHKRQDDPLLSTPHTSSAKAIEELYNMARLNGAAMKHGYAHMSPEDMAAFVLKEGRTDLGFNKAYGRGTKDTREFEKELEKYVLTPRDIDFLRAVKDKQDVAKRLKIPFAMAWNGTGVNVVGTTGKQYAEDYEKFKAIVNRDENKELRDLIARGVSDGQKYGFILRGDAMNEEGLFRGKYKEKPYKAGGPINMPAEYSRGAWKLL